MQVYYAVLESCMLWSGIPKNILSNLLVLVFCMQFKSVFCAFL